MKNLGFLGLVFILIFSACRKDVDVITVTEETLPPIVLEYEPEVSLISGSINGVVEDESYTPVSNATVTLGALTTTTDAYGNFFFRDVTMNKLGSFVQIEKEGYFLGSRRFFPNSNTLSHLRVQLIKKNFTQSFSSTTGATIEVGEGGTLFFPANSVYKEDGSLFEGNINIATYWLDPTNFNTYAQMPGNLQGINERSEEVSLASYGMLVAELESDNGEALNVTKDRPAFMTLNVPEELLENAPTEIPLWSFHEEVGMWVQESTATLENGTYVGNIPHFSFWNCDYPYPLINLDFSIEDVEGNPVAFHIVQIILTDNITSIGAGYTDENGFAFGKVPLGESLTIHLYDLCGNTLYSQVLGSFTEDTSLGVITVPAENIVLTNLTGNLVDCVGAPLMNGVVRAIYNGQTTYQYTNGTSFDLSFVTCPSVTDIEVIGSDLTNLLESAVINTPPNTATDLGDISVCAQSLENYFVVNVDGIEKVYTGVATDAGGSFSFLSVYGEEEDFSVATGFAGDMVGSYVGQTGENFIYDAQLGWNISGEPSTYDVTQYDTKIVGSYTGQMTNSIDQNNPISVNVTFYFNVTL